MKIKEIKARKILNSAGNWTIECKLLTDKGEFVAAVPQGISRGKEEKQAVSPQKAIFQIEKEISPLLRKNSPQTQEELDRLLNNPSWGSNATLAVSAAFFKSQPLPSPSQLPQMMMLVFEGKKHGNPALKIQEFMVIVSNIEEGKNAYEKVKKRLEKEGLATTVGSEGGFSPFGINNEEEVIKILEEETELPLALDVAADTSPPSPSVLLDIVRRYRVISIEDPLPETKKAEWKIFFQEVKKIKEEIMIVADDLTVTNPEKIAAGGEQGLFNAVIIKPNQQGTISQATKAIATAKQYGLKTIVSHRGEETNDSWIVDLAIKENVDFVKFGAPCRGERIAKYNRLLSFSEV